jgi:hypothetical protein
MVMGLEYALGLIVSIVILDYLLSLRSFNVPGQIFAQLQKKFGPFAIAQNGKVS